MVTAAIHLTVGSTPDIVKEESSRTINEGEPRCDSLTGVALDEMFTAYMQKVKNIDDGWRAPTLTVLSFSG